LLDLEIGSELGHFISPSTTETPTTTIASASARVIVGRGPVATTIREAIGVAVTATS